MRKVRRSCFMLWVRRALSSDCSRCLRILLSSKVLAAVLHDDQVRVTIDRKVCGEANLDYTIRTDMENPALTFPNQVILELKFTNRFPDWFRELVRVFGVMQCGAAKYCECVQGIGFKKLGSMHPVIQEGVRLSRSW